MLKKQKILTLDAKFAEELEALCETVHTNFSTKTKELLFIWHTEELKKLELNSPNKYHDYLKKLETLGK